MTKHIEDFIEDKAREGDGQFAVAYAILQLARHQKDVAYNIAMLGFGNAATNRGAIEVLAEAVSEAGQAIDGAIRATIED